MHSGANIPGVIPYFGSSSLLWGENGVGTKRPLVATKSAAAVPQKPMQQSTTWLCWLRDSMESAMVGRFVGGGDLEFFLCLSLSLQTHNISRDVTINNWVLSIHKARTIEGERAMHGVGGRWSFFSCL